jgi:hypothetical protein
MGYVTSGPVGAPVNRRAQAREQCKTGAVEGEAFHNKTNLALVAPDRPAGAVEKEATHA